MSSGHQHLLQKLQQINDNISYLRRTIEIAEAEANFLQLHLEEIETAEVATKER